MVFTAKYTQYSTQQTILANQILSKTPTELQYAERSVFVKEVNTRSLWNFELGIQEGRNILFWMIVGFQQRDREDSQNLKNDTFDRNPLTSTQCIVVTEKYPNSAILLNYNNDDYNQRYGEIEEASKAVTKDDILKPYISDNIFRLSSSIFLDYSNAGDGFCFIRFRYTISEKPRISSTNKIRN